jgi:uncharacterized protein (DUF4415 family)
MRISRRSHPKARVAAGKTNWAKVAKLTDERIAEAAARDPDTFIPDASWWRRARIVVPASKKLVSLRIDGDVLDWFRAQGPGYQTRINAVLRSYVEAAKG